MVPVGLFVYISRLVQLQNPTLLMTPDIVAPIQFCSGETFPIVCHQYPTNDPVEAARYIKVISHSLMFFGATVMRKVQDI